MMKILKHYRKEDALRRSFNDLAKATFGLNFENWYQMGYWGDNYEPYSVLEDGKIVANVSLNRTDMVIGGQRKRLYQLGTVMTYPEYRNRGYIRAIMDEIEKDIADADGVYLFAGDNVLEFYPKFGFAAGKEYQYGKPVCQTGENRMIRVKMDLPENREKLARAMAGNRFGTACTMVDNPELIFFYAAQFMQDCVYHDPKLDAWVIAEEEDGVLTIHNVFAGGQQAMDDIIGGFGSGIREAVLGFAPADPEGWDCRDYHEEDCTFFVKGEVFRDFEERKLRIPTLSHA
nr:GNAT family N-acetyltransferase [Oscillospiraceae bacterium]